MTDLIKKIWLVVVFWPVVTLQNILTHSIKQISPKYRFLDPLKKLKFLVDCAKVGMFSLACADPSQQFQYSAFIHFAC